MRRRSGGVFVALVGLLALAWLAGALDLGGGSGGGGADGDSGVPQESRTYLVTRVVDGDTIDLEDGSTVRLVGIDTPEIGECGYQSAAAALRELVGSRRVRLGPSDEDRDGYGRLLRYVDVRRDGRWVDAGLTLVRRGHAVARYDSRDGFGRHPRERAYVAADRAAPDRCR